MSIKTPAAVNSSQPQSLSDFSFVSRATYASRSLYATPRPWSQLLDLSAFSRPCTYADAMLRVRRNFSYFKYNYVLVSLVIIFVSLFWHPIAMIVCMIVFIAWYFLYFTRYSPPVLFDQTWDDGTVLCGLGFITVSALVLAGVGLNLFVSSIVAVVIVGLHAAFRVTDDFFLDEETAAEGGLVSVVGSQSLTTTYTRV
ncbi:PRA1 family protein E-like [Prosopis cineraria]|uniref:PRA1 family protein E-like n=1 Tax=Prosopis cineraria TaxID=364024 RepID=UPI00240F11ED|nr:PRA1 family protein E-like [Prosopis cineraria]XP_054812077.1 PRA1 family protein E-like [Prosopis cineraria]